jgi:UDP-N-acetylglucosamine--N-acetylmuramyl-(pentapeptide) pyrophosphoryl-undecaprenol N-acetylglucosamine transferase
MLVVITTGGTGGHIYPALALGEMLLSRGHQVVFIGNEARMEATLIPEAGFIFYGMETQAIQGSILKRLNAVLLMRDAYVYAKELLTQIKPDIVIGFGGYVTVPVILAAHKLKYKIILHEQNSIAGKANLFLQRFADAVVTSYEETNKQFNQQKVSFIGNPRAGYFKNCQREPKILRDLGLVHNLPTVMIVMGSLGSLTMNEHLLQLLKSIRDKNYQVIYVTGKKYYQEFMRQYNETTHVKVFDYLDMRSVLPNVDLLICRAGATTLTEITALGIPSILIPSPYVPMNHQFHNAQVLVSAHAALMMEEKNYNQEQLISMIDELIAQPQELKQISSNAKKLGNINACDDFCDLIERIYANES